MLLTTLLKQMAMWQLQQMCLLSAMVLLAWQQAAGQMTLMTAAATLIAMTVVQMAAMLMRRSPSSDLIVVPHCPHTTGLYIGCEIIQTGHSPDTNLRQAYA